jgi:cell division protein FtsI/penicillin-binding protein 2
MRKRRERELKAPKSERKKSYNHRFLALGIVFCVICTAFLVYLGVTQIRGAKHYFPRSDDIIRTKTVYGERGRIFDRNGKLLVGNTANYNLIFEYGSMADKRKDVNLALIDCLEALSATNTKSYRAEDYFPLMGTYPNMSLKNSASDTTSDVGYYYQRFLKKQKLASNTSAEQICKYFVNKYKLWQENYSNAAISELIRIYYDMERVGFG